MSKNKKRFVVIESDDAMFCTGIFHDRKTAIGAVMESVWDFKNSYQEEEGNTFEYSEFEEMEGESGIMMTITYKAKCWQHALNRVYYILEAWAGR